MFESFKVGDKRWRVLLAIAVVMAMMLQLVASASAETGEGVEAFDPNMDVFRGDVFGQDTDDSGNMLIEPMSQGGQCRNKKKTSLNLTVSSTSTTAGNNVTLSARLTRNNNGVSGKTITFTIQNSNGDIVDTLSSTTAGSGKASAQWTSLTPGKYTVIASFSGDKTYCGSDAEKSVTLKAPPTGSVRIVKKAPDDPHQLFSFTGPNGSFTLKHTDNTGYITENLVTGQDHEFREVNIPDGWVLSSVSCDGADKWEKVTSKGQLLGVKVRVNKDKQATCTFTNERAKGVWITKQTVNAPAGDETAFSFSWYKGGANLRSGETHYVGKVSSNGSLTITEEQLPPNWSLKGITCTGQAGGVNTNGASVTIQGKKSGKGGYDNTNRLITCTFTNEYTEPVDPEPELPTVTVYKQIQGHYDPSNLPDGGFEFNIAGQSAKVEPGDASDAVPVQPGTNVSVSEIVPTGWTLAYAVCFADDQEWLVDGDGESVAFTMPEFDVFCEFVNEKEDETPSEPAATVRIVKIISGIESDQKFRFTIDDPLLPDLELGHEDEDSWVVGYGNFTITEQQYPGWTVSDIVCNVDGQAEWNADIATGSVTITGVVAFDVVTCDFTNVRSGSDNPGSDNPPPPPPPPSTVTDEDDETPIVPEQPSTGPEPEDPGAGEDTSDEIVQTPPAAAPDLPFTGGSYLWYLLSGGALASAAGAQLLLSKRRRDNAS